MALESQVVSVAFGQGLDSKTDPKVTAKPVLIQDGIFTNPHRISKRNGYDSLSLNILTGGTISSPTMAKSYKSELLVAGTTSGGLANGARLFSYSKGLGAWSDRGKYVSTKVTKNIINSSAAGAANSSCAVSGNIALYAFDRDYLSAAGAGITTTSYITVIDLTTGVHLLDSSQITNSNGYCKAVLLGASTLGVLYITSTTTNKLAIRIVSVSAGGVSVGSEVIIGTCLADSSGFPTFKYSYDAVTTSTGLTVITANTPNVGIFNLNISAATTASATMTGVGKILPVNVTLDSGTGNIWAYWCDSGTAIYYQVFSSSLGVVLAKTVVNSSTTTNIQQIVAVATNSTTQSVYYSQHTFPASREIGVIYPAILTQTVQSNGTVGAQSTFLNNADIYTKPFSFGSANYLGCISLSPISPTAFIVDLSDGIPVAKILRTLAEGLYSNNASLAGSSSQTATYKFTRYPGLINLPISIGSGKYLIAAGVLTDSVQSATSGSGALSMFPSIQYSLVTFGVSGSVVDFSSADCYRSLIQQDTAVLNGGIVSQYDGNTVTELGFSVDPDGITGVATSTGGNIGAGTFVYYVTYEWMDSLGNLHQSAPSIATKVILTGTTNQVTIYAQTLTLTQKQNVQIKFWRTQASTTVAYLFGTVSNTSSAQSVSIVDGNSDSALVALGGRTLYTEGGAILENIAPPPATILWSNNTRIWAIDSENPETNIEPSKTASSGSGISFCTGLLTVVIDSKGGSITGASPMDEKTVILKDSAVGYFIGDAANDAGGNSKITNFQFVPSDTGCSNPGSVILYPDGVLFRASNNKGIYKLDRGANVRYFGSDVEAYNSQDIRSAFIVPNLNHIRFLTSSGSSLLYDYVMNQWSVFTNHAGLSADSFNGLYVYVRSDGLVYQENTATFLDSASSYAPAVKLQWIKASSVQNFQRLRRIALLGDYTNGSSAGHGVQISAAYDFGTSFSTPVAYSFGASSSSGSFQYREGLPRQKCDSIQLLIQEVTTGASGEFIDFTDIGLEIAVKRGLNKLPATRSV